MTWHLAPEGAWVVAWNRDRAVGGSLETDAASLADQVDAARSVLDARSPGSWDETRAVLSETSRLLMSPVADLVDQAAGLVILPHGPLHGLSFPALRDDQGGWLGVQHAMSRAPSATVLGLLRSRCGSECQLVPALLVGNPTGDLDAAAQEAEAVGEVLSTLAARPGDVTVLLEDEASEGRVVSGMDEARTLLLSTHGVFWPDAPRESHVRLAASGGEDGRLTVAEIAGLQMQADLVFLSGCSTGRAGDLAGGGGGGGGSAGDDVLGVSVAFQIAGAERVVATLWDVADSSSGIYVQDVFGRLAQGIAPAEALRQARQALIEGAHPVGRGADTTHPAYWAPFVLIGPS